MDTEEADIYFLIDGSSSIHRSDFGEMKKFLTEVIKLFNVGPNHVRFGVVQYSSSSRVQLHFKLDEYTKGNTLEKAINNINQLTGDTYTGKALTFMQPLFEEAKQQRGNKVPCHLIVLTDGEAHDDVKKPSEVLRKAKVNIYAIGVRDYNKTQLHEIAGPRVYSVHQFDSLKDIQAEVVRDLCTEEGKINATSSSLCLISNKYQSIKPRSQIQRMQGVPYCILFLQSFLPSPNSAYLGLLLLFIDLIIIL